MTALPTASPRILLVEDSPGQCELLGQALAHHGLRTATRIERDVDSALAFLDRQALAGRVHLPQVILVDVKLAHGTGLDLLRRLRTRPRLAFIPVVMLTTSDDPEDIRASYAGGANSYLIKPGTFSDLVKLTGDVCHFWLQWNRMPDVC